MQLADDEQCVDSSHALNIYTQDELEIEVATLYLETYYNGYESKKIARQIAGTPIADPAPDLKKRLKMAYVGMSRPRYSLCFAMQKSNFTFDSEELRERWDEIETAESTGSTQPSNAATSSQKTGSSPNASSENTSCPNTPTKPSPS